MSSKNKEKYSPNAFRLEKIPIHRDESIRFSMPESEMRHPRTLIRRMWSDLLSSRSLSLQLLKRDISSQYRQSILGFLWAFIPPIITAVGFTFASNAKVLNIGETDIPYPAYVMLSTTLWQVFAEALTIPVGKFASGKSMLSRVNFPREALILASVGQVLFNFLIKLVLIVSLFIWFQMAVPFSAILSLLPLLHLILLGTCFGMLIAPLAALYSDLQKALPLFVGVWLFLTPVVFPVPNKEGFFGFLVNLNPVTPILVTTRELATTGVVSNPTSFWIASLFTFIGLLVAWPLYRLAIPYIVERFSS